MFGSLIAMMLISSASGVSCEEVLESDSDC